MKQFQIIIIHSLDVQIFLQLTLMKSYMMMTVVPIIHQIGITPFIPPIMRLRLIAIIMDMTDIFPEYDETKMNDIH